LEELHGNGTPGIHDDKQTVATFLSGWLERKVEDGALRPSSVRMYRLYVEAHLAPALGPVRLQDLRPLHVEQLLRDLRRAGKGPTTVRRMHAGLRWSDVELAAGVITVCRQLVQVGHGVVEGAPKTRAGDPRRVDIGARTIGVLMAHQIAQASERASWGSGYTDGGRVFAREDGTDLHPEQIIKTFTQLAKAAGLRPVRKHDLRHGGGVPVGGTEMAVMSKRLGHSSIAITVDTYSHLLAGVGRQAADVTEALVRPRAQESASTAAKAAPTDAPTRTPSTPDAPTLRPQGPGNDSGRPPGEMNALVRTGAPSGTRTPNPLIKSQLLCQLS